MMQILAVPHNTVMGGNCERAQPSRLPCPGEFSARVCVRARARCAEGASPPLLLADGLDHLLHSPLHLLLLGSCGTATANCEDHSGGADVSSVPCQREATSTPARAAVGKRAAVGRRAAGRRAAVGRRAAAGAHFLTSFKSFLESLSGASAAKETAAKASPVSQGVLQARCRPGETARPSGQQAARGREATMCARRETHAARSATRGTSWSGPRRRTTSRRVLRVGAAVGPALCWSALNGGRRYCTDVWILVYTSDMMDK